MSWCTRASMGVWLRIWLAFPGISRNPGGPWPWSLIALALLLILASLLSLCPRWHRLFPGTACSRPQ
eukprot:4440710-Alexandrium_andersonii.AAC.1